MNGNPVQMMIAMCAYISAVIVIGLFFAKRANKSSDNFFLGGRTLGPWVASLSAEASDMSGWLLMGLPGVAYFTGISDAFWTALGLAVGTYVNWLVVARRLRRYSIATKSITVPEFISNRFHEKKKIIMTIAALFIIVFFTVYTASCFVTCGKLFSSIFGVPYIWMMIAGAVLVLLYTFLGGFLAESASDLMQAIVMVIALVVIFVCATVAGGGITNIISNIRGIPGFLEFFGIASPALDADKVQQVVNGAPQFGEAGSYGLLTVISTMSWGLGYFGMPQVLLRFMAIRSDREIPRARRIGITWCIISLGAAVFIGLAGRALYPTDLLTSSASENIFILLSTNLLPSLLAGLVLAGIVAAAISSSDSYLLIAASAIAKDVYKGLIKKDATDRQVIVLTRIVLVAITVLGVLIALDENSVIFKIVSFAWAGFGATFGPIMLFSLFWKRTTQSGAIAGMIAGGGMVFIWKFLIKPLGGVFGIYELFPAFVISCIFIVVFSLLSAKPSKEIEDEFDAAKTGNV